MKKMSSDTFLHEYIGQLARYGSFMAHPGLLNGKLGVAIILYKYVRKFGDQRIERYADELIDEVLEAIDHKMPMDIPGGVAGIGIGLMYLQENGFVEVDPEEFFQPVDDLLWEKWSAAKYAADPHTYFFGIYYLKRYLLHGANLNTKKTLRRVAQKLVKSFKAKLTSKNYHERFGLTYPYLHAVFYFLLTCRTAGIEAGKIDRMFRKTVNVLDRFLPGSKIAADEYIYLKYLSLIRSEFNTKNTDINDIENTYLAPGTIRLSKNDHLTLSKTRLIYDDDFEIASQLLSSGEVIGEDDSVILTQLLENATLDNLSLDYPASGLALTLLNNL